MNSQNQDDGMCRMTRAGGTDSSSRILGGSWGWGRWGAGCHDCTSCFSFLSLHVLTSSHLSSSILTGGGDLNFAERTLDERQSLLTVTYLTAAVRIDDEQQHKGTFY